MSRLAVPLCLAALVAAAGSAVARPAAIDPPRIVPWTQIGGVKLGDALSKVTALYGSPTKTVRDRTPGGTRWAGHRVVSRRYRVVGGFLWVSTVDGRVRALGTSSTRYRTPDGIHVGLRIPLGPCHPIGTDGSCVNRWRDFAWAECPGGWSKYKPGLDIELYTGLGPVTKVSFIEFGDPDVILPCF